MLWIKRELQVGCIAKVNEGFAGITKSYRTSPTPTISPKNNTLPEGYVAVITGGASGIGEYIARSYVEAKASGVVITGRRAAVLEEAKGKLEKLATDLGQKTKVTTCTGDAETQEAYIKLRELVEKEHGGRLDALVCNAGPGTTDPKTWTKKIHEQDVDSWDSIIRVNLCGPFYAAKHLIPLMLNPQSQGKTIVNIVSGAAHMTAGYPPIAYSIGKLGEARLAQNISEAYAEEGIQAFALHPGGVVTASSSKMSEDLKSSKQTPSTALPL